MSITLKSALHRILFGALMLLNISMRANNPPEPAFLFLQTSTHSNHWRVVNDDVMGGVSSSQFEITEPGNALFKGTLSLENNGGFASVRSLPFSTELGEFDGFVINVRGDGRRYRFTVKTDSSANAPIYQYAFETQPGKWQEKRLELKNFVPSFRGQTLPNQPSLQSSAIKSVGFLISDKQEGPFALEIQSIQTFHAPR